MWVLTSTYSHQHTNTQDGKPKPTLADQIRRHGPTFAVWWGTLWVAGAAGLFGVSVCWKMDGRLRCCSIVGSMIRAMDGQREGPGRDDPPPLPPRISPHCHTQNPFQSHRTTQTKL